MRHVCFTSKYKVSHILFWRFSCSSSFLYDLVFWLVEVKRCEAPNTEPADRSQVPEANCLTCFQRFVSKWRLKTVCADINVQRMYLYAVPWRCYWQIFYFCCLYLPWMVVIAQAWTGSAPVFRGRDNIALLPEFVSTNAKPRLPVHAEVFVWIFPEWHRNWIWVTSGTLLLSWGLDFIMFAVYC